MAQNPRNVIFAKQNAFWQVLPVVRRPAGTGRHATGLADWPAGVPAGRRYQALAMLAPCGCGPALHQNCCQARDTTKRREATVYSTA